MKLAIPRDAAKGKGASRLSAVVAALIASLFLSLLWNVFYNEWIYELEGAALGGLAPALTPLKVFTALVLAAVSLALVMIIKSVFAVSMNGRIRQLGVLSTVGATPRQLRGLLVREAAALCLGPVALGTLGGTALSYGLLQAMNRMAANLPGRRAAVWQTHPLVLLAAFALAAATVVFSAWLPARKLSKLSPLEAAGYAGEVRVKRKLRSPILSRLFGVEGELAGNALKAQRKALRASTLSLTLAFLGFTMMLCFFTLADISTGHTYFERYQGAWDVMLTVKGAGTSQPQALTALRQAEGVGEATAYRKARATALVGNRELSDELLALGGPETLSKGQVAPEGDDRLLPAPIVILDDESYLRYCRQTGCEESLEGAVLLNRIWDSAHSSFRYPQYVPYLKETTDQLSLCPQGEKQAVCSVPAVGFTDEPPLLREEYDDYALTIFLPQTLWSRLEGQLGGAPSETTVRLLARDEPTLEGLNAIEERALAILTPEYAVESENRLAEKQANDDMLAGYKLILGGLCALLAVIGLADVFTYALTFVSQRRRELARYQALGMTPGSLKKLFCVEALVIALRPLAITLPLTVAAVSLMIRMSDLNPAEFWQRAPYGPVAAFSLGILFTVGLAYFLGGRKALKDDLAEALTLPE